MIGLMEESTMDNGLMESNMVRRLTPILKARFAVVSGTMENVKANGFINDLKEQN